MDMPVARVFLVVPNNAQVADDKTVLASPTRIHDMLYNTLGIAPPPSWNSSGGGGGRGASKRASLGPTDTTSLQELLKGSGAAALSEVRYPHQNYASDTRRQILEP